MARLAPVVLAFALVTGCKGMGGVASGLGHVAGGMAKVASGVGKVAGSFGKAAGGMGHALGGAAKLAGGLGRATAGTLARATPAIARTGAAVARAALPIAENVAEAAAFTTPAPDDPIEPPEEHVSIGGPLIDDHDPCNQCPDDLACEMCTGFGDAACRLTPAGAYARCESTAPRQ